MTESLPAFILVSTLLSLAPGPDNLFVLALSASRGARQGLLVVSGLALGLCCHTLLVASGVAALVLAQPDALIGLRWLGGGYLLWLAFQTWQAANVEVGARSPEVSNGGVRLVLRGLLMNLTNPKVLLFFLAFLPQFVAPGAPDVAARLLLLGLVFMLVAMVVFASLALMASWLGGRLRRHPRGGLVLQRLSALVLAVLALRLWLG